MVSASPRPKPRVRSGDGNTLISPPPLDRSAGVRGLVRSIEETAALDLSFESRRREREMGRVQGLGRVREVRGLVEEGSFEGGVSF
jgi:hypothetical protein